MNQPYIPPVRVLEAQYINGTKVIMHRVQLWLGHGQDPLIVWMKIEEWRQWCGLTPNEALGMARQWKEWDECGATC